MKNTRCVFVQSKSSNCCTIPVKDIELAYKELTSGAFKLLMYYYTKYSGKIPTNIAMSMALNVSERRIREVKKELIDKEYLLIDKSGSEDYYYVGKVAVAKKKSNVH